jgi:hypothetical protein
MASASEVHDDAAQEGTGSIVSGILQAVLWIAITLVLLLVVPRVAKVFFDFGVKLPQLTLMVIDVATFTARYWYVVLPLPIATSLAWLGGTRALGSRGLAPLRIAWQVFTCLVPLVLLAAILLAIVQPLINLQAAISGPPP